MKHTTQALFVGDGCEQKRRTSIVGRAMRNGRPVYVKRYTAGSWRDSQEIVRARSAREVDVTSRLARLPGIGGRLGRVTVVEANVMES